MSRSSESGILAQREPLPDEYLGLCERDARRFQGAWTGTSGTLASHVMHLLGEVRRLRALAAHRENHLWWREPHD